MAAVAASSGVISEKLKQLNIQDKAVIAVHNGDESQVISGETWAVNRFLESCHEDGIRTTKLNVEQGRCLTHCIVRSSLMAAVGFHSACIEPCIPTLRSWLEEHNSQLGSPNLAYYSTALARRLDANHQLDAQYWVRTSLS